MDSPLCFSKGKIFIWLTAKQFHYAFTNTMSDEEAKAAYDRYQVPGPARPLFQAAFANFNPKAPSKVDFHDDSYTQNGRTTWPFSYVHPFPAEAQLPERLRRELGLLRRVRRHEARVVARGRQQVTGRQVTAMHALPAG